MNILLQIWEELRGAIVNEFVTEVILETGSVSKKRPRNTQVLPSHHITLCATSMYDARKFVAYLKVIKAMIDNLQLARFTSKRDIYYKDVSTYKKSQRYCDTIIDSIATSLGMCLEGDLRIFPSRKGLIYGSLKMHTGDEVFQCKGTKAPSLIPNFDFERSTITSAAPKVVIIIEKDAVFSTLCDHLRAISNPKSLLVITGKGNPDILTKKFVELLSKSWPTTPFLGFVDSDVFGLGIFRAYKFGSQYHTMSLRNLSLAGVFLHEYNQGHLDITSYEIHLAQNFLLYIQKNLADKHSFKELAKWQRELCRSMMLYKKSEMNLVDPGDSRSAIDYILSKADVWINQPGLKNYATPRARTNLADEPNLESDFFSTSPVN